MQSLVCHGCRKPLLSETNVKNIFDDEAMIKSIDSNGVYDNKWSIKLLFGIEVITSQKITKEQGLPDKLCNACFKNVEAFINFRDQLLRSRDIFFKAIHQNIDKSTTDINQGKSENSSIITTSSLKIHTNEDKLSNQLPKTSSEDLINVDDNSNTSSDVQNFPNRDEINNSLTQKLQIEQENSKADDSDVSVDNIIVTNVSEPDNKHHDHDVESEIDVCSGEEDDVLELDVQKTKNETVEINSSSESDIEVCDYEPVNKRGNYGATLSPPLRF